MPRQAHSWMHPRAASAASGAKAAHRSALARSLAVLDAITARLHDSDADVSIELAQLSPGLLASVVYPGSALTAWPPTAEGREIAEECSEAVMCAYQMGRLRNTLGIVVCQDDVHVVWLSVEVTPEPRSDGFVDDKDAALGRQRLEGHLGRLLDLAWMEEE